MAQFPCSRCGRRYAGPQRTAYPAVVTRDLTYTEKLRLCPECFSAVVNNPAWSPADPDTPSDLYATDLEGHSPADVALFCTYYERRQERQDLYGRICGTACLSPFLHAIFGAAQPRQRGS